MMLLLLMFVFQVPTFPVGVTGSFEVLAFTPVPQLIFLKKGTNCYSCWVGCAAVDCLQSSREGFSQQPGRRMGPSPPGFPGQGGVMGTCAPWHGGRGDIYCTCSATIWFSLHPSFSLLRSPHSHGQLFPNFLIKPRCSFT